MPAEMLNILDDESLQVMRLEQARMLNAGAVKSCKTVAIIISVFAIIIYVASSHINALIWSLPTYAMVLVVYFYAKRVRSDQITEDNYQSYLIGHTIISGMTGFTWSLLACYLMDWSDPIVVIISGAITTTLPVGGMLPGAMYRREYIALATMTLLPYTLFVFITAPFSLKFFGLATLAYYGLCVSSSMQAEINVRDGIFARKMQKMTERLAVQNEEIRKNAKSRMRFLEATSHDFAQPLQAQGYFIQALRKLIDTPDQIKLLDKIETSWSDQAKLLEGIVSIIKLESGAIKPKMRPIHLATDMQKLESEYENKAKDKNIIFNVESVNEYVLTDPILLSRVLRNLLSNAIKFTATGGEIRFKATRTQSDIELEVTDTGTGISTANIDRIFDEYVQLENANSQEERGLGLGLSIVRRLTDLMNLDLNVDSHLGKGTCFKLTLPITDPPDESGNIEDLEPDNLLPPKLIIIVDDEPDVRDSMTILVTSWGCQVMACGNGDEAIALLNITNQTPALCIVDKRLSNGEDGVNVIERLREEVNEDIPAILMTGDIKGLDHVSGNTDIQLFTKPLHPDDLRGVLETL